MALAVLLRQCHAAARFYSSSRDTSCGLAGLVSVCSIGRCSYRIFGFHLCFGPRLCQSALECPRLHVLHVHTVQNATNRVRIGSVTHVE